MAVIAVFWIGSTVAFAQQSTSSVQAAQNHFARGNTAYNLGHFDEAAELFSKAYEAWPQPEFLYNIAQAYRLGGNCKQALHFYKRFRSLKEGDLTPLSQKKKDEIDKFITEATECSTNVDRSAGAQPITLANPQPATPSASSGPNTSPSTAAPEQTTVRSRANGRTAALDRRDDARKDDDDDGEDEAITRTRPGAEPRLFVARLTGGVTRLSTGDLEIPVQPVFGIIGGYPIHLAPLTIEIGAALSYISLPYLVDDGQKHGMILSARATMVASYPIISKLLVRGDLGLGIVSLTGLETGNPLSVNHEAASFILPSVRLGVAVDYQLSSNIAATVSPLGLAFSPGSDGMYGDSLREIDIIIGIGYRQ